MIYIESFVSSKNNPRYLWFTVWAFTSFQRLWGRSSIANHVWLLVSKKSFLDNIRSGRVKIFSDFFLAEKKFWDFCWDHGNGCVISFQVCWNCGNFRQKQDCLVKASQKHLVANYLWYTELLILDPRLVCPRKILREVNCRDQINCFGLTFQMKNLHMRYFDTPNNFQGKVPPGNNRKEKPYGVVLLLFLKPFQMESFRNLNFGTLLQWI